MWDAFCAFHICIACSGNGSDFGQPVHLQVAFGSPLGSCHVPEALLPPASAHSFHREGPHDTRSSSDLPHQPFQRVIGAKAAPVFGGHCVVGQGFIDAGFDDLCSLVPIASRVASRLPGRLFLWRLAHLPEHGWPLASPPHLSPCPTDTAVQTLR